MAIENFITITFPPGEGVAVASVAAMLAQLKDGVGEDGAVLTCNPPNTRVRHLIITYHEPAEKEV